MISTNATEVNRTVRTDPNPDGGQKTVANKGVLLQAKELAIHTGTGATLLSDISFHIEPGELVALTGVSRSADSALLQSLAGLLKPASGEILVDGVDLYSNLKAFRPSIGYVTAEFALQPNLTVAEVLQEAAMLRLPRRTPYEHRQNRISALLETVGLAQASGVRIGRLSPVEQRRLSIAVELLNAPGYLLLDEPAEPLTPFEEIQITILLREFARQGLTVIQADRRARSAGLSDKVIFLAPGGGLAWFGPPNEAFDFLRGLVPKGIAKDLFGLKEAIEVLANPQAQEGIEWAKRFKADDAYQKYVDDPLQNRYPDLLLQTHPLMRLRSRQSSQEKLPPPILPRANTLQKLILLVGRNVRLLWRDKTLYAMLIIPPLIALVDFLLSSPGALGTDRSQVNFGLLSFLVVLLAGLLAQNEIFKERAVYQRESRTASLSFPYILSKVWLAGILAAYQGLVWAAIHFAATGMAGGLAALLVYGVTFFLLALIGGIIGLMVSAFSRTAMATTSWLLLLTVPQLIFNGVTIPAANLGFPFNFLSGINPSRYALEILIAANSYAGGLNVAPLSHWFALAIMSFGLMVLLLGIQQGTGNRRI